MILTDVEYLLMEKPEIHPEQYPFILFFCINFQRNAVETEKYVTIVEVLINAKGIKNIFSCICDPFSTQSVLYGSLGINH